jgi:hypothetical protein
MGETGRIRVACSWRVALVSALLCVFALGGFAGRTPTAHAAGPGYCEPPPVEDRAPTHPAPHLNRSEGPVGTNLAITASGWRPGARVTLHFDGRDPKSGKYYALIPDLAKGRVARDGTISLSSFEAPLFGCSGITISDSPDFFFNYGGGSTGYFVLAADDGRVSAPVAFKYLAAPTVAIGGLDERGRAKVGASITVTGSGWEPREPLTMRLQNIDSAVPRTVPYTQPLTATTDTHGAFTAQYPLDARLRWNSNIQVEVEGSGPRFGVLDEYASFFLVPEAQPTLHVGPALVTPGMTITVTGEHWYPGVSYTIKYCAGQPGETGWVNGPNCGKQVNPAFGMVTADAHGQITQQFRVPSGSSLGVIMVRVDEVGFATDLQPIPVRVVDHLPTWDDIHPRIAALRNKMVASLPFTIPAILLLGALAYVGIRRWRGRRLAAG